MTPVRRYSTPEMACLLRRNAFKLTPRCSSVSGIPRCVHPNLNVPLGGNVSFFSSFFGMNNSIANSSAVQLSKESLIELHEWLHIPWFAEIALVTIATRFLVTFPLTINQRKIVHRYEALQPEILRISGILRDKMKKEAFVKVRSAKGTQIAYSKAVSIRASWQLTWPTAGGWFCFIAAYKRSQSTDSSGQLPPNKSHHSAALSNTHLGYSLQFVP